jgi:hypothetical protein
VWSGRTWRAVARDGEAGDVGDLVYGQAEPPVGALLANEDDKAVVAQLPQRPRRRARLDAEMLGNETG